MKTPLLYGFYIALAGAVVTLLLYFFGMYDTAESLVTADWIRGCAGILVTIVCLALAMRGQREVAPAGADWGYGSAFGVGVTTGLFAALFSTIFAYVYFAYINPNMSDLILQAQVAKMEAHGMSADRISQAEPMMRKWMSAPALACVGAVISFIVMVVLSLIVAIFYRAPRTPVAAVR